MSVIKRKIALEEVKFNAPIGFFEEERILKNNFLFSAYVSYTPNHLRVQDTDDLEHTVDYSKIYDIAKHHFSKEAKLLEHVAHGILNDIVATYPFLEHINIQIKKLNPPIQAEIKNSLVELIYQADAV
ncbi:dihydroneopterin aldolase [Pedobacter glucosidilyticus]|uniref:dihydroneopterin aldolase n=1 Tax=Pedobacter glucosidilyticus TaxID=1122941 RepID=UPI0026F05505|nr:dihydroneopterin aldolase [Pedobacter glucosidilyticus]